MTGKWRAGWAGVVLALACASGAAAQTAYPAKPIRLVVPFSEGRATDVLARVFSQRLADGLGQPVEIENRTGNGGSAGSELVARASPDGYTLLLANTVTHSIQPAIDGRPDYDPVADFTPITMVATAPSLLLVSPTLPVTTVRELVAYAKSRPNDVTFASSGRGSLQHLVGAYFRWRAELDIIHVVYKSTALAVPDLMTGHVDLMFESIITGREQLRSGALRALAVTSPERSRLMPELPTLREAGLDAEQATWYGILGPAKLPPEIVARLNAEIQRTVRAPEVTGRFMDIGAESDGRGPEPFAALIRSDLEKWRTVVKGARLRPE